MPQNSTARKLPPPPPKGTAPRWQGIAHNTNPLHWLRRQLRKSNLDLEDRSHVTLWLETVRPLVSTDPRHLAILRGAAIAYAQCTRLESLVLQLPPDSKRAMAIALLVCKWESRLANALRLVGLRSREHKRGRGNPFSAPRVRTATENDAESIDPSDGSDAGDGSVE